MDEQKQQGIAPTRFKLERVQSARRLQYVAETPCVLCGDVIRVRLGAAYATFRVGSELVGIACDDCLTPESRATLATMRGQAEHGLTR